MSNKDKKSTETMENVTNYRSNKPLEDNLFDYDSYPEIPQSEFVRVPLDLENVEKFEREGLTFWQDAWKRLTKNRGAIVAVILLLIIVIMSFAGPSFNDYKFDEQIKPAKMHAKLPPRVPGLENIGIFDGTRNTELGERRYQKLVEEQEKRGVQLFELQEEFTIKSDFGMEKRYRIKEYTYIKNEIEDEYFWFGTDDLARDLWTRIWKGTRISLYVGLLAAVMDMVIGVTYGAIAGFYGGKVDIIMMRITEVIGGIPWLVIVIIFILILGTGLLPMSFAIAISGWIGMARVVRAQFLKLRDQEFLLAARTLGTPNGKLITKHLIPNVIGQIVIMITFSIPGAIFTEAFLAFIGLGIPSPNASLGSVINDSRTFLKFYPSMVFIPSAILSVLMLSINIFANGLRDALDPRMRNN